MSSAPKKLLQSMMAGDLTGACEVLHADNVIHEADSLWYGGDWKGPEGFAELFKLMTSKLDVKINSYEIFEARGKTTMQADVTFTSKVTKRHLNMEIVELYREKEGKIVDMDIYYKDTAAVVDLAQEA